MINGKRNPVITFTFQLKKSECLIKKLKPPTIMAEISSLCKRDRNYLYLNCRTCAYIKSNKLIFFF